MAAAVTGRGQARQQPRRIADAIGVVDEQQPPAFEGVELSRRDRLHPQQPGQIAGTVGHDRHLDPGAAGGRAQGGQGTGASGSGRSEHQGVLAVVQREAGRRQAQIPHGEADVDAPILAEGAAGQVPEGEPGRQRSDPGRSPPGRRRAGGHRGRG